MSSAILQLELKAESKACLYFTNDLPDFFLLYTLLFGMPYWLNYSFNKNYIPYGKSFYWLFLSGPILFALKMSHRNFAGIFYPDKTYHWYDYAKQVLNWPINALLLLIVVFIIWKIASLPSPVAGLSMKRFSMAAFYCSIHFGKPLLECITSYFGGIILGVIVYRTKSIWGGLLMHLGIAWMMELAA
ncbi:MAG: hypothetical protein IPP79_07630 [Chitinophagaceae bacterium]|nr:hypothetical protein [Chitinophagaceae bacterium]